MISSREALIVILKSSRSRKAQSRVEQRFADGLCLNILEDGSDCNCKATKKGRCAKCYNAFYYRLLRLTPEQQVLATQKAISSGLLLGTKESFELKDKSTDRKIVNSAKSAG